MHDDRDLGMYDAHGRRPMHAMTTGRASVAIAGSEGATDRPKDSKYKNFIKS